MPEFLFPVFICMQNSLNELGVFAETKLHPKNLCTVNDLESLINSFQSETSRLLHLLPRELLNVKSEKHFELKIQQVQSILISIADTITEHHVHYQQSFSQFNEFEEAYNVSINNIVKLLTYIENNYKQYFNQNQKVPDSYLVICRTNLKPLLKKLRTLSVKAGLVHEFIDVIFYPHIRILNNTNITYTFKDLIFTKKLIIAQQELIENVNENLRDQLIELSIYFNCNNSKLYKYIINLLINRIETFNEITDRLKHLGFRLKQLNQTPQKPGYSFNAKAISLKEQISIWIEEELSFLEKQMQLQQLFSLPHEPADDLKGINVSLSVKELAFLTRVMMDTKIIYNRNKTYVAQQMAMLFRTKENHIQPHSMSRKIHLKEEHAMNNVKDQLIKMINHINKMLDE
jgi:hypothetical protein